MRSFKHGGYALVKEHLPSQTQAYYEYSPQYFIDKGSKYGPMAEHVLRELFSATDRPAEVYYRSAQGILALARETEPELFLLACKISVQYGKRNYPFISNLVKSKCQGYLTRQEKDAEYQTSTLPLHENIRGSASLQVIYYYITIKRHNNGKILSDLKAMRLPGMAQTWQNLMEAHKIDSISMADGIRMLIQGENDMRMSNRTHRLIKNAHFRYTVALGEIAANLARGIDQSLLNEVATCDYIRHGYPIIITGPTGTGKSWLASALGHHACLCGYKVLYYNVMKLFEELTMARIESRLPKLFERLSQYDQLILDDFAIKKLTAEQVLDLMEIIEDRHGNKSTIFASQLPVANWYETLDSNVSAADAILDRVVNTASRFALKGDSLRKKQ